MTTYLRKHRIAGRRQMGSLASGGLGSLGDSTVSSALNVATDVASDPYLAEMLCHVHQLGQIQRGETVQACASTPMGLPGGIGLSYAVVPARMFVFARQNPIAWVGIAALFVGLPMAVGYAIGRSKRST